MKRYIILTLLLLTFFVDARSQNDKDEVLKNEQIDIIKAYEPVLIRANKVMISPKLPELKSNVSRDLKYDVPVQLMEVEYQPSEIKPLQVKSEPPVELPIMRLKAGFGNYLTPLVNLDVTNKKTDKYRVGLNVDHLSSMRSKRENQRFSETAFKVFGEYNISENIKAGAGAQYMMDNYFLYGYNDADTSFTKSDSKVGYNTGGGNLFVSGNVSSIDLKYGVDFSFNQTNDSYNNKSGVLDLGISAEKAFNQDFFVGANIDLNHNKYRMILNDSRVLFSFNPYAGYNHKRFKIHAGFTILTDDGEFGILPDIKLNTVLIPGMLSMYNQWIGDINYNNLYSAAMQNPWLRREQMYENGTTEIRTIAGFTGTIARKVDYDVRISQLVYQDKLLFLNDTTDDRRFVMVYDSKLTAWNPHIMVGYSQSDFLSLKLAFDYYKYNSGTELQAWHLPQTVTTFSGTYNFNHKLSLKADLFVESGRKTQLPDKSIATLKPIADLNFGASYYFNKNIGLFTNVNNVLSLKRERYRNYNLYGFQVLGGFIASF